MLRFVGFRRFVGFNFGQIQLLKFIVVMVRSYSFGHIDLVMLTTLNILSLPIKIGIKYLDFLFILSSIQMGITVVTL